jgi:hypothetical protein
MTHYFVNRIPSDCVKRPLRVLFILCRFNYDDLTAATLQMPNQNVWNFGVKIHTWPT